MSGEVNLTEQNMEIIVKALDEYESQCGLPAASSPCPGDELNEYLSMDRHALEVLSAEDCGQISYRLGQSALYIQRSINREEARIVWSETSLQEIVNKDVNTFDKFVKYEVRVASIIAKSEPAAKLTEITSYAKQRVKRLTYIATSLKNLSDIMLANQRSKYYGQRQA